LNRRRRKAEPLIPVWRGRLLLGLFALAAVALEVRLVWLQAVASDFYESEGDQRQLRTVETPAHRGLLTDRNGVPLAVSTLVGSIFVDPKTFPRESEAAYRLASALELDGANLERRISSDFDRRFLWVKRRMPLAEAEKIADLDIDGVAMRLEYKRFYPEHEVTCHIVGFAGDEDVGQEGLEIWYDYLLAGEPGRKLVQRDLHGRVLADVEQIQAARPGRDIRTSIDMRLQTPAYLALKAAVQESGASSGSLVLLDAQTGEVLAMVNQPACNPNDSEHRGQPALFRNRAITDPLEPGSTVKPLVLATALTSGYTPETLIDVPKDLMVAGRRRTNDQSALGIVTVTEILARSSSVGMGLIGLELERAEIWGSLKALGLGGPTASGLGSFEDHGTLNHFEHWTDVDQASLSFGYGLSVTPLQLARAYLPIASTGLMPPISFVALDEPPAREQVIDQTVVADLLSMLEVVVSEQGTAQRAAIANYRVAGKTGTARIAVRGDYSDDEYHAIFAGIAPASRPRFVAVVVINDPRGQAYYGGDVAAPVFAKVVGTALRMYGVAPDDEEGSMLVARAEVSR